MPQKNLLTRYKTVSTPDDKSPTVVDLFCGCGGLSLGFQQAGFKVLAGIDHDKPALQTFQKNLNTHALDLDLADDNWVEKCEEQIGVSKIDVLIGGPPCQGYSLTGTRNPNDPRNKLYNSVFVGIERFDPEVVLIENVRGMATLFSGKAKEQVINEFETRGYEVSWGILDSAEYGVPQHRLRLFFLAHKQSQIDLPKPVFTKDNFITCEQALDDLHPLDIEKGQFESNKYITKPISIYQKLMRSSGLKEVSNHEATRHKQFVIDTIKLVPEGKNYKSLPPGVGTSRTFNEAWTRYHSKKPSRTIDTGHRNHFHYKQNRVPTVRENARLQSFPDHFEFCGTRTSQNRQVGNAVPVLLAQAIAMQIKKDVFDA